MKIVATHNSPDWDAITSVWLIKRFLPGWKDADIKFVPAGERIVKSKLKNQNSKIKDPIERIEENEVIHVDTGLGILDHHQTDDQSVSAAGLTWEYIKMQNAKLPPPFKLRRTSKIQKSDKTKDRIEAIGRLVRVVVDIDHFKEVFWGDPVADYHEFSLLGVLDGLKVQKPDRDDYYVDFGMQMMDAVLHDFGNRIWAEREIENGYVFETRWGKGIGIETINDQVLHLAQKMGYVIVVRKDPRKGYVRVKARPSIKNQRSKIKDQKEDIDLTRVYEALKKMDPNASWFLHVSKKMLLNGSVKNPKMKATRLGLTDIIKVLERI